MANYIITATCKQVELLSLACNQAMRIHIGQLADPLTVQLNFEIGYLRHHDGKQMAAKFYEVDERTVTNCLNANDEELRRNGYKLLQGEELKEFKQCFGQEMDFPTKTTILGVFDFRSFKTAQLVDNLIQLAPSWKRDYEICNTCFTGW